MFFCDKCSDWFTKQAFLEEISEIKTKFEYLSPIKCNINGNFLKNEEENENFQLNIKTEGNIQPKNPINQQISHENIDKNQEFSFNCEILLSNIPLNGCRLPIADLLQLMFFYEFLIENLINKRDLIEKNKLIALLQLLASLPFKNQKLLTKIITKTVNQSFLEKEILEKLVPKMVSIYGEDDALLRFFILLNFIDFIEFSLFLFNF